LPRSGHTASLYGHLMIIFGGILDVCKELDDMLVYNIETRKWVQVLEELMLSPIKQKYGSLIPSATSPTDFNLTMSR